jgi:hypothetical protein
MAIQTMRVVLVVSGLLSLLMLVMIIVSFVTGDFFAEGSWIVHNPWGRMSLVDIYVGCVLILMWVILRGEHWAIILLCAVSFIVLGNLGTCLYVFITALRSKNNVLLFLVGDSRQAQYQLQIHGQ